MTARNFLLTIFSFCLAAASVAIGQEKPQTVAATTATPMGATQTPQLATPTEQSIEKLRRDVNKLRITTERAQKQAEERLVNQRAAEQAEREASEQRAAANRKAAAEKAARENAVIEAQQRATMRLVLGSGLVLAILIVIVIVLIVVRRRVKVNNAMVTVGVSLVPESAVPVIVEEKPLINPSIEEVRALANRKGMSTIAILLEHEDAHGVHYDCMVVLREANDLVHFVKFNRVVRWDERFRVIKKHLALTSTVKANS